MTINDGRLTGAISVSASVTVLLGKQGARYSASAVNQITQQWDKKRNS
jgi:hypothetical protein